MRTKVLTRVLIMIMALSVPGIALAQTLSSPNYKVEDPTIDTGGGELSNSANFQSRGSLGDVADDGSSSSLFKVFAGFFLPAYPGIPGTPTLTNTGGTLYNSLDFVVNKGNGQQDDTTYAIAISSDNFATTYFIQNDDTLGTSEAWQTYTNWGGVTGERVTGLSPSTTYKIKVKASFGSGSNAADSETGYSDVATATTAAPNLVIVFAGVSSGTTIGGVTTTTTSSTNSISYGALSINSPLTSAHQVTVTTNAVAGYTTTLQDDGELRTTGGSQINPITSSNASPGTWNAAGTVTAGRFGYHTTDATLCTGTGGRFSSNDTYAAMTTSPLEVACNTGPVTSETTTVIFKLEIGSLQANGSYANVATYITTAQF
jgi:hypothetical protein